MEGLSKVERIDRFGHCCYCSAYLLTKRVVDGKIVDMFTPQYDQTTFLLDNGSQMQITICKKCKESVDLHDEVVHKEIMDAVMKGWELEAKQLVADEKVPDWTEEKSAEYLGKMSQLNIDCNSELMNKADIQTRAIELMGLKVEEIAEAQIVKE